MKRFQNKTALITGGASGMGKAAAERLASEGCRIIIADKNKYKALEVIEQLKQQSREAFYIEVDLTSYESIQEMGSKTAEITETVHVLVNSAGVALGNSIDDTRPDQWEPGFAINVRAPLYVAAAVLPLLRKEGGSIVNIASDGAFKSRADCSLYDASKAALVSLSKSMAAGYVKYGIRVNTVAPGWTASEFHFAKAENPEQKKKELEEMDTDYCMMRRLARPEEIAAAIAFLASGDASFVTGATLCVDGGRVGF